MFRRFSTNFALISMCLDAGLVILALSASNALRPLLNNLPFTSTVIAPSNLPLWLYCMFAATWVAVLLLFSVYDGRRNLKVVDEITSLTLGSILAGVALAGTLYLSYREVSRIMFLTFIVLSYSLLAMWRMAARMVFRLSLDKGGRQRRVLIVGAGPLGGQVEAQIEKHPYLGLNLIGYVDDDPEKRCSRPSILGALGDVSRIVLDQRVEDVVIALPRRAYARVNTLVAELHTLPVRVWIVPDYVQLALHKARIEEFAGIPMMDLRAPALNDYQRMIKRLTDLLVLIIVLPPTSLVMGIIALAIRLESPGPIIFRQMRVGENGRLFEMLKFRTMVQNAEQLRYLIEKRDENGHLVQNKNMKDPRVTRVGRILRRTSLDELPQLFNILRGDMSLVGPRPELPYLVAQYEPWQHKRFAVPQGMTGWWQINGRSDRPMHLHTEDDLYYVQNYSLMLDLYIIFKTIGVLLRGRGAY